MIRLKRVFLLHLALVAAGSPARTQSPTILHAAPSSRATTEVQLTYPRAPEMKAMPDMPVGAARAATPNPRQRSDSASAAMPESSAKPFVISIDYGQPHLRGRTLHIDSLVPYDKPWRTGASASTTLATDVDLVLGGTTLQKGKYVLYTLPSRAGWKLIVQRSAGQSAMTYEVANDLARLDLRLTPLVAPIESLTIWLIPSTDPGPAHGELRIAWGVEQLSVSWAVIRAP